jgi:hypothetical protein
MREMSRRVSGVGRGRVISLMTGITLAGRGHIISAVAARTFAHIVAACERKRGRMLKGRGPLRGFLRMTLLAIDRKSRRLMSRIGGLGILLHVTGFALCGQRGKFSRGMTGLAIQRGVRANQRKARLRMPLRHFTDIGPTRGRVALRAQESKLPAMHVFVAALARGCDFLQFQTFVAFAAIHRLMPRFQREVSLTMIKCYIRRTHRCPIGSHMARIAIPLERSVGIGYVRV